MVHWQRVAIFYVTALGAGSALASPLWLDERHLSAPYFLPLALAMMTTPTLGALTARSITVRGNAKRSLTGKLNQQTRWSSVCLAIALPLVFSLGSVAIGVALQVYAFDPKLSGFAERTHAVVRDPGARALVGIASVIPAAFVNALPALGEEIGWRGFLLDELRAWPALHADVLIGLLWGFWHAPLILLGYNYPNAPLLGAFVLMPCQCVWLSIWLGWLRRRSGSVYIAALAHGAYNAAATLAFLFYRAGSPPDPVHTTVTGWTGWLMPAAFGLWLVATGREPVRARTAAPSPEDDGAHPIG